MRETRSSGSVEGVMGNHDSYSDSGDSVHAGPWVFIAPPLRGC